MLLLISLLTGCDQSSSQRIHTIISPTVLPENAQSFIQQHFSEFEIKEAVCEKRTNIVQYEVDLKGGVDLQFDRNGICTEVNCKKSAVPEAIIPNEIIQIIHQRFPGRFIIKYEHDNRLFDIDLNDGTELAFNRSFRLIDIDQKDD